MTDGYRESAGVLVGLLRDCARRGIRAPFSPPPAIEGAGFTKTAPTLWTACQARAAGRDAGRGRYLHRRR